jgi:Domain of unknown function (DUF6378)
MSGVEALLQDRKKTHGEFGDQARVTQVIMETLGFEPGYRKLSYIQKEAIHMIAHKLARIVSGNPDHADHWDDIAGYARLVGQRLVPPDPPKSPERDERPDMLSRAYEPGWSKSDAEPPAAATKPVFEPPPPPPPPPVEEWPAHDLGEFRRSHGGEHDEEPHEGAETRAAEMANAAIAERLTALGVPAPALASLPRAGTRLDNGVLPADLLDRIAEDIRAPQADAPSLVDRIRGIPAKVAGRGEPAPALPAQVAAKPFPATRIAAGQGTPVQDYRPKRLRSESA